MAWSYPTAAPVGWDAEAQWRSFEGTNQPRIQAISVRSLLEAACPRLAAAFEVEDEPGQERLLYVEMGAAARSLGEDYRAGKTECLPALFAVVEQCISEGTSETKNLVVVGLLEDLQNSNVTTISDAAVWEPYLGARSRAAWRAVSAMWEGDLQAFRDWASSEGIELP
jgi:hypothetical protein